MRTIMPDREFLGHVFKLALPIAFQQLMLSLSSCADTLMLSGVGQKRVGRRLARHAVPVPVQPVHCGPDPGHDILVAQYWGAGNRDAVERVLDSVMLYAGMLSTAFFLAALLAVPEQLMSIMTNDGTLIMLGARYLRISSLSYLFIGLSQMYLCLMKNTGSAVMGMTVSTVGVIVHVVLNAALLIYGIGSLGIPALGIFGAAISTVISRD